MNKATFHFDVTNRKKFTFPIEKTPMKMLLVDKEIQKLNTFVALQERITGISRKIGICFFIRNRATEIVTTEVIYLISTSLRNSLLKYFQKTTKQRSFFMLTSAAGCL